jgi:hypothetical protein
MNSILTIFLTKITQETPHSQQHYLNKNNYAGEQKRKL